MLRALLLADTHLGRGQGQRLVERVRPALERCDVVLHAGDVTDASVLVDLASFAPVFAVRGNNDVSPDLQLLPERTVLELDGCLVAVVHDSGPAAGRGRRLRRWFPEADVVVFGHSHIPWHETDVDAAGHAQHHVNPGSAIQRRRQPVCTVAEAEFHTGRVVSVRTVPVPSVRPGV